MCPGKVGPPKFQACPHARFAKAIPVINWLDVDNIEKIGLPIISPNTYMTLSPVVLSIGRHLPLFAVAKSSVIIVILVYRHPSSSIELAEMPDN